MAHTLAHSILKPEDRYEQADEFVKGPNGFVFKWARHCDCLYEDEGSSMQPRKKTRDDFELFKLYKKKVEEIVFSGLGDSKEVEAMRSERQWLRDELDKHKKEKSETTKTKKEKEEHKLRKEKLQQRFDTLCNLLVDGEGGKRKRLKLPCEQMHREAHLRSRVSSSLKVLYFSTIAIYTYRNCTSHQRAAQSSKRRMPPPRVRYALGTFVRFFRSLLELMEDTAIDEKTRAELTGCSLWHPIERLEHAVQLDEWALCCSIMMKDQIHQHDLVGIPDKDNNDMLFYCPSGDRNAVEGKLAQEAWGMLEREYGNVTRLESNGENSAVSREACLDIDSGSNVHIQLLRDEPRFDPGVHGKLSCNLDVPPLWREVLLTSLCKYDYDGNGDNWTDTGCGILLLRELLHWEELPKWAREQVGRRAELCAWLAEFLRPPTEAERLPFPEAEDVLKKAYQEVESSCRRRFLSCPTLMRMTAATMSIGGIVLDSFGGWTACRMEMQELVSLLQTPACESSTPVPPASNAPRDKLAWGGPGKGKLEDNEDINVDINKDPEPDTGPGSLFNASDIIDTSQLIREKLRDFVGRQWLVQEMLSHLRNSSLLLLAHPGFGKSSFMAYIVSQQCLELESHNFRVVASHFCIFDAPGNLEPLDFVKSLAAQLMQSLPRYRETLKRKFQEEMKRLKDEGGTEGRNSVLQVLQYGQPLKLLREWVLQPLLDCYGLRAPPEAGQDTTCVIAVDSMDEALLLTSSRGQDSYSVSGTIVELLGEMARFLRKNQLSWLRLLCSSRDEPPVRRCLQIMGSLPFNPGDVNGNSGKHLLEDLKMYAEHRIQSDAILAQKWALAVERRKSTGGDPDRELLEEFVSRSECSFEWMVMALSMLCDSEASDAQFDNAEQVPPGMKKMYGARFLRQFDGDTFDNMRPILEVLCATNNFRRLTSDEIFQAVRLLQSHKDHLGNRAGFDSLLDKLRGYITLSNEAWRFNHKTLPEWLTSQTDAGEFWCCVSRGNLMLAGRLLRELAPDVHLQTLFPQGRATPALTNLGKVAASPVTAMSVVILAMHLSQVATLMADERVEIMDSSGIDVLVAGDGNGPIRNQETALSFVLRAAHLHDLERILLGCRAVRSLDTLKVKVVMSSSIKAVADELAPRPRGDEAVWTTSWRHLKVVLDEQFFYFNGGERKNVVAAAIAKHLGRALSLVDNLGGHAASLCNPMLEALDLKGCNIGEAVQTFAAAIEPRQSPEGVWHFQATLASLDLQGNSINAQGAKLIAAACLAPRWADDRWVYGAALSTLVLSGNRICQKGAMAIADALAPRYNTDGSYHVNRTLQTLYLSDAYIGDRGAEAIAQALSLFCSSSGQEIHIDHSLTELDLSGRNMISAAGAKAIAELLLSPAERKLADGSCGTVRPRGLKRLNLSSRVDSGRYSSETAENNSIGTIGARAIADALMPRRNGAEGCNREDSQVGWVVNTLEQLNLAGNCIDDDGAVALGQALMPVRGKSGRWHFPGSLKDLNLSRNPLSDRGLLALAEGLAPRQQIQADGTHQWVHNDRLHSLDLSGIDAGDEGIAALVDALLSPKQGSQGGSWVFNQALATLRLGRSGARTGSLIANALCPRICPSSGAYVLGTALQRIEGDYDDYKLRKQQSTMVPVPAPGLTYTIQSDPPMPNNGMFELPDCPLNLLRHHDKFKREDVDESEDLWELSLFRKHQTRLYSCLVPTLVPDNHVTRAVTLPDQQHYTQKFFDHFPFLEGVLKIPNVTVAGGAAAWPLGIVDQLPSDVDIFIFGIDPSDAAGLWNKLDEVVEALKCCNGWMHGLDMEMVPGVLNVRGRWCDRSYYEVQVILRAFPTVSALLHGFDIASCQVAFNGQTTVTTMYGAYAHIFGVNVVNPEYRSTTYERRLIKYFERGYAIAFPHLSAARIGSCGEMIQLPHMQFFVRHRNKNLLLGKPMLLPGIRYPDKHSPQHDKSDYYNAGDGTKSPIACIQENVHQLATGRMRFVAPDVILRSRPFREYVDGGEPTLGSILSAYQLEAVMRHVRKKVSHSTSSALMVLRRYTCMTYAQIFEAICSEKISISSWLEPHLSTVQHRYMDEHDKPIRWWITERPTRQEGWTCSLQPRRETQAQWYGDHHLDLKPAMHPQQGLPRCMGEPNTGSKPPSCSLCLQYFDQTCQAVRLDCNHMYHYAPHGECKGLSVWHQCGVGFCPMCYMMEVQRLATQDEYEYYTNTRDQQQQQEKQLRHAPAHALAATRSPKVGTRIVLMACAAAIVFSWQVLKCSAGSR